MGESKLQIEELLTRTAGMVEFPETPDLSSAVEQRIRAQSETVPRPVPRSRFVFALAAVVLVLLAFFAIAGDARRAVAEWLGVSGVRIEVDEGSRSPAVPSTPVDLALGERMTLAEARQLVDFQIAAAGILGDPDQVWVDDSVQRPRVSFVFEETPDLPADEITGVGAVLTQFRAGVHPHAMKKVAGTDTEIEFTELNGRPAYWIEGAPHEVVLLDTSGAALPLTSRLAGNVLLWESGEITLRLESGLSFEGALRVAHSITP